MLAKGTPVTIAGRQGKVDGSCRSMIRTESGIEATESLDYFIKFDDDAPDAASAKISSEHPDIPPEGKLHEPTIRTKSYPKVKV